MTETLFEIQGRAITLAEAMAGAAGIVIFLFFLIVALAIAGARRRRRERGEFEAQILYMARSHSELTGRLQMLAEAATNGHSELKRSLDERLDQVGHRLGQNLFDASRRTGENLNRLNERLAVIDTAQRNLTDLSSKVVGLQEILSNKQARGAFGQGRMETIIADGLPKSGYSFQYTLSNGKRPDCVIFVPDSDQLIAIDAKFPLEGMTALKTARDAAQKREAETRVRTDISRHINELVARYRVPGEVQDTLILFVPSESTYADLYESFDDLIQKAYRARVVIVSPNMLMLAVQTMQTVMKDAHMRKQAGIIQIEVVRLLDDVGRLTDRVADLQKHFNQSNQDIDKIVVSAGKITGRGRKIEALDFDDEMQALAARGAEPKQPQAVAENSGAAAEKSGTVTEHSMAADGRAA